MFNNKIRFISNGSQESDEVKTKFLEIAYENGFVEAEDEESAIVVFAIGGDGCFLRAVHKNNFRSESYYIGYNTGHVGFLQDDKFSEEIFVKFLSGITQIYTMPNIINDSFEVTKMNMLSISIKAERDGKIFYVEKNAVNDIEVSNNTRKIFKADLYLNGTILESFFGDAILISSPTGSTAHSMNAGGAVILEDLPVMQLTPIQSARSNLFKNLINPMITSKVIRIVPSDICYTQIDGMELDEVKLDEIKEIRVSIGERFINRVHLNSSSNKIETIKAKFL